MYHLNLAMLYLAVLLSVASGFCSILGLTTIFPGSFLAILFLGIILEMCKVVISVWLHQNWDSPLGIFRYYLVCSLVTLMIITSSGVFGFLTKSHIDKVNEITASINETSNGVDFEIQNINEQIKLKDTVIAQHDTSINAMTAKKNQTDTLLKLIEVEQTKKKLVVDQKIALLKDKTVKQNLQTSAKGNKDKLQAELGPLKYLSEIMPDWLTNSNEELNEIQRIELAAKFFIIMLVLVIDPLALTMMVVAFASLNTRRRLGSHFLVDPNDIQNMGT